MKTLLLYSSFVADEGVVELEDGALRVPCVKIITHMISAFQINKGVRRKVTRRYSFWIYG